MDDDGFAQGWGQGFLAGRASQHDEIMGLYSEVEELKFDLAMARGEIEHSARDRISRYRARRSQDRSVIPFRRGTTTDTPETTMASRVPPSGSTEEL